MTALRLSLLALALTACSSDDGPSSAADASTAPQADGQVAAGDVPTDADTLFAFLQRGDYRSYLGEPAVHASAGPHGGGVRTYFHPKLEASLRAEESTHPVGAATVKELYTGGELSGWAVMVKTGSGNSGADWYFYEVFSVTDGSRPVADGNGLSGCAGCHSSGQDHILTDLP